MATVAVICEYDPFHRGHKLQIDLIRKHFGEDCTVISLMSGNTVQRGRLAVYPKHLRAKAALSCGSDLVLELPCPFSSASAEHFATGAVRLLDGLGGIDYLCFGSERGDLAALVKTTEIVTSPAYLDALKDSPEGESHPRNAEAVFTAMGGKGFPTLPNDILGVEYLAALKRIGSSIAPFTYRREEGFSASESRRLLYGGTDASVMIPEEASAVFSEAALTDPAAYEAVALFTVRETPLSTLEGYYAMNGGVAGLLKNRAGEAVSFGELIALCTSRKYTASRLRRAVLSAVLGLTDADRTAIPLFTNLLGANEKGRQFLRARKKTSSVAVVTKPADGLALPNEAAKQFELTLRADRLLALTRGEAAGDLLRKGPVVIE
ncbi:MAG: nucleotidyltransferase family protein [Clostridia bacterium]|nr:nucleotidyltransferase family protein [Clostridia bacterium]